MSMIFDRVKRALRLKTSALDDEVTSLIEACVADLRLVGIGVPEIDVTPTDTTQAANDGEQEGTEDQPEAVDPLISFAIVLYAKANYGFNADSEKFRMAYDHQKCTLSLAGDYIAVE